MDVIRRSIEVLVLIAGGVLAGFLVLVVFAMAIVAGRADRLLEEIRRESRDRDRGRRDELEADLSAEAGPEGD